MPELKPDKKDIFQKIHSALHKLIGLHRQLMDCVRLEHDALVQAEVKAIQECTYTKQALIESVRQAEIVRQTHAADLARLLKRPLSELTLPALIIEAQGDDQKFAEQLRSAYNALTLLVKRISEQNEANRALVEKSLEHVQQMKKNILGETTAGPNTYTAQGQKSAAANAARLISKEA